MKPSSEWFAIQISFSEVKNSGCLLSRDPIVHDEVTALAVL